MKTCLWLLCLASLFAVAQPKPRHQKEEDLSKFLPPEFREEEIEIEVEANRKASSGSTRIQGVKIKWDPEKTLLEGDPVILKREYWNLVSALQKSPALKPLIKELAYREGSKTWDLGPFLQALKKREEKQKNIYTCFSFSLWYLNEGRGKFMDEAELNAALKKKMKARTAASNSGDVVLLNDAGRDGEAVHTFVYVSPFLSLEKRGGGSILIRPPSEIKKDYSKYIQHMAKTSRYSGGRLKEAAYSF
jgi:hypothetical protein